MNWSYKRGNLVLNLIIILIAHYRMAQSRSALRVHQRNLLTQSITIKYDSRVMAKTLNCDNQQPRGPMILSNKGRNYCMIYIN